jgi:hypothetical protein
MLRLVPIILLPAVAGCSTLVPRPVERGPVGQTLQVIAADGSESRMQFRSDGRVVAAFGQRSVSGEWNLQDEGLCFRWGQAPVECWPYERPFRRGETVTVTSTRGNVVRVTPL